MKSKMDDNGYFPLLDTNGDGTCCCQSIKRCTSSPSRTFKICCIILAGVLITELLLFNFVLIYGILLYKDNIGILFRESDVPLVDRLGESAFVKKMILNGKLGGFSNLLQNTVERLYIDFDIPEPYSKSFHNTKGVALLGVDVSNSGEALYIYRRYLQRQVFPYSKLVVDVGANDGIMSSNSFNFIQWGWDAILVEPDKLQLQMARQNMYRYIDAQKDKNVTVRFVEGIIGSSDGIANFVRGEDIVSQQGHVADSDSHWGYKAGHIMKVDSYSVQTFTYKYDIPKMFGVLSIDAEGMGNIILHDFIDLGFRPAYIIYEHLHNIEEGLIEITQFLADHGYRYLTSKGWNYLYEHLSSD